MVFEFIFTRERHAERFLRALRSDVPVHLLTLWAPLAIVDARERGRADRERLGDRAAACRNDMAPRLLELGAVVAATGTPEEALADVRRRVADGSARLARASLAARQQPAGARMLPPRWGSPEGWPASL